MRSFVILISCYLLLACGNSSTPANTSADSGSNVTATPADTIALTRQAVSDVPVAEFSRKTDNPLNDWYFRVKLYETPKTFHYLMRMQFEEIIGEDTLKLPNFGTMPKPVIRPGNDTYSCIVGFLDKQGNFREYKKVYVKNNSLKVTTLRHYSVRSY